MDNRLFILHLSQLRSEGRAAAIAYNFTTSPNTKRTEPYIEHNCALSNWYSLIPKPQSLDLALVGSCAMLKEVYPYRRVRKTMND